MTVSALILVFLLSLPGRPAVAVELSPIFGNRGGTLAVLVTVPPDDANHRFAVELDNGTTFYRSYQEYLRKPDGSATERMFYREEFKNAPSGMPDGHYTVNVSLYQVVAGKRKIIRATGWACISGPNTNCQ